MPFYNLFWLLALLTAVALFSERLRMFFLPAGQPHRLVTAASAIVLAGLGVLVLRVLVFDYGDNAYLYVLWIGLWLLAMSVPFALTTVLPEGRLRRIAALIGVGLLLFLGALNTIVLVWSLAIIPSQDYKSSDVFVSHLASLLLLLGAVAVILTGHRLFRAH